MRRGSRSRFRKQQTDRTEKGPEARRARWKGGNGSAGGGGRGPRGGANPQQASSPEIDMEKTAFTHLRERTGRTLEDWVVLVRETGPATRRERAEWLKTKHGVGANFAAWIALRADGAPEPTIEPTDDDAQPMAD